MLRALTNTGWKCDSRTPTFRIPDAADVLAFDGRDGRVGGRQIKFSADRTLVLQQGSVLRHVPQVKRVRREVCLCRLAVVRGVAV